MRAHTRLVVLKGKRLSVEDVWKEQKEQLKSTHDKTFLDKIGVIEEHCEHFVSHFLVQKIPPVLYGVIEKETVSSLLLAIMDRCLGTAAPAEPLPSERETIFELMQLARPEMLYIFGVLPLDYMQEYLQNQEHFSLVTFLRILMKRNSDPSTHDGHATDAILRCEKWFVFMRSARELIQFCAGNTEFFCRQLIGIPQSPGEIEEESDSCHLFILSLSEVRSCLDCERRIEDFYNTRDARILLCVANMALCSGNQLSFLRTSVDRHHKSGHDGHDKLVVVVVTIPPEISLNAQFCYNSVFLNAWSCTLVDSLGISPDISDMQSIGIDPTMFLFPAYLGNMDQDWLYSTFRQLLSHYIQQCTSEAPIWLGLNDVVVPCSRDYYKTKENRQKVLKDIMDNGELLNGVLNHYCRVWRENVLKEVVKAACQDIINGKEISGILDVLCSSIHSYLDPLAVGIVNGIFSNCSLESLLSTSGDAFSIWELLKRLLRCIEPRPRSELRADRLPVYYDTSIPWPPRVPMFDFLCSQVMEFLSVARIRLKESTTNAHSPPQQDGLEHPKESEAERLENLLPSMLENHPAFASVVDYLVKEENKTLLSDVHRDLVSRTLKLPSHQCSEEWLDFLVRVCLRAAGAVEVRSAEYGVLAPFNGILMHRGQIQCICDWILPPLFLSTPHPTLDHVDELLRAIQGFKFAVTSVHEMEADSIRLVVSHLWKMLCDEWEENILQWLKAFRLLRQRLPCRCMLRTHTDVLWPTWKELDLMTCYYFFFLNFWTTSLKKEYYLAIEAPPMLSENCDVPPGEELLTVLQFVSEIVLNVSNLGSFKYNCRHLVEDILLYWLEDRSMSYKKAHPDSRRIGDVVTMIAKSCGVHQVADSSQALLSKYMSPMWTVRLLYSWMRWLPQSWRLEAMQKLADYTEQSEVKMDLRQFSWKATQGDILWQIVFEADRHVLEIDSGRNRLAQMEDLAKEFYTHKDGPQRWQQIHRSAIAAALIKLLAVHMCEAQEPLPAAIALETFEYIFWKNSPLLQPQEYFFSLLTPERRRIQVMMDKQLTSFGLRGSLQNDENARILALCEKLPVVLDSDYKKLVKILKGRRPDEMVEAIRKSKIQRDNLCMILVLANFEIFFAQGNPSPLNGRLKELAISGIQKHQQQALEFVFRGPPLCQLGDSLGAVISNPGTPHEIELRLILFHMLAIAAGCPPTSNHIGVRAFALKQVCLCPGSALNRQSRDCGFKMYEPQGGHSRRATPMLQNCKPHIMQGNVHYRLTLNCTVWGALCWHLLLNSSDESARECAKKHEFNLWKVEAGETDSAKIRNYVFKRYAQFFLISLDKIRNPKHMDRGYLINSLLDKLFRKIHEGVIKDRMGILQTIPEVCNYEEILYDIFSNAEKVYPRLPVTALDSPLLPFSAFHENKDTEENETLLVEGFLNLREQLPLLRYVPTLVSVYKLLNEAFGHRITLEESWKYSVLECIELMKKKGLADDAVAALDKLWPKFRKKWEKLRDSLGKLPSCPHQDEERPFESQIPDCDGLLCTLITRDGTKNGAIGDMLFKNGLLAIQNRLVDLGDNYKHKDADLVFPERTSHDKCPFVEADLKNESALAIGEGRRLGEFLDFMLSQARFETDMNVETMTFDIPRICREIIDRYVWGRVRFPDSGFCSVFKYRVQQQDQLETLKLETHQVLRDLAGLLKKHDKFSPGCPQAAADDIIKSAVSTMNEQETLSCARLMVELMSEKLIHHKNVDFLSLTLKGVADAIDQRVPAKLRILSHRKVSQVPSIALEIVARYDGLSFLFRKDASEISPGDDVRQLVEDNFLQIEEEEQRCARWFRAMQAVYEALTSYGTSSLVKERGDEPLRQVLEERLFQLLSNNKLTEGQLKVLLPRCVLADHYAFYMRLLRQLLNRVLIPSTQGHDVPLSLQYVGLGSSDVRTWSEEKVIEWLENKIMLSTGKFFRKGFVFDGQMLATSSDDDFEKNIKPLLQNPDRDFGNLVACRGELLSKKGKPHAPRITSTCRSTLIQSSVVHWSRDDVLNWLEMTHQSHILNLVQQNVLDFGGGDLCTLNDEQFRHKLERNVASQQIESFLRQLQLVVPNRGRAV